MESIITLEFSTCFDSLSSEKKDKQPRILDCGHSFCFECICNLTVKDHNIHCPICSNPTTLDTASLPLNHQLISILSPKSKITTLPCECSLLTDQYCPSCPTEPPLCPECFSGTHLTAARKSHVLKPLSGKFTMDCAVHKQQLLLYCFDDDQLICLLCGHYGDHKTHRIEPIDSAAKMLRSQLTKTIQKRERMGKKINQQYIEAHHQLMNIQVKKYLLDRAEGILQKCTTEANDGLFLSLWSEVMKEPILKIKEFDFLGNILTKENDLERFLIAMIPEKYQMAKTQLIYRGTRDGLNGATFGKLCAHKAPTLTLIRTSRKYIFGGFTPVPWSLNNSNAEDPSLDSFLFSLKNPWNGSAVKFPLVAKANAVYSGVNEGPSWNFAHLRIYLPNANYCHANGYYNFGAAPGAYHSCSLLDGGCSISVEEIEVYLFKVD